MNTIFPREFYNLPGKRIFACIPSKSPNPNDCENCGGSGYMYAKVAESGPYDSPPGGLHFFIDELMKYFIGETISALCPVCKGNHVMNRKLNPCGLSGDDLFSSFDDFINLPGNEQARSTMEKIIFSSKNPCGIVTISGGFGTGKTRLAKISINEARKQNLHVLYTTAPDLLGELRESYSISGEWGFEKILAKFKRAEVLAIDEIDKVNITPWALETLFRIVDMRYELRTVKLTIFTMNTRPDDLPEALGYLSSRLKEGLIIEVTSPDVRPAKGLQAKMDLEKSELGLQ